MKTIDIQTYRAILDAKKQEIAKAQLTLSNLMESSSQLVTAQTAELRGHITQGATTGSALVDGIIVAHGLDLAIIDGLTTFNERLMSSKGQECLIAHAWRRRHTFTSYYDEERHSSPQVGYVFGRLTGESLLIEKTKDSSEGLSFPFDGYVMSDLEIQQETKRFPGRFVTKAFGGITTSQLIFSIIESNEKGFRYESKILIGEEIEKSKEAPISFGGKAIYNSSIESLRDTLLTAPVGGQRELLPV